MGVIKLLNNNDSFQIEPSVFENEESKSLNK